MTLHVRDLIPPVPEVRQDRIPIYEEVERPLYREVDGLLIETGRSVKVQRRVGTEVGPEYETDSLIFVDKCNDCGAELVPHDEREISFYVCGTINFPNALTRPGDESRFLPYTVTEQNGAESLVWKPVDQDAKPYPGCVLECGNWLKGA